MSSTLDLVDTVVQNNTAQQAGAAWVTSTSTVSLDGGSVARFNAGGRTYGAFAFLTGSAGYFNGTLDRNACGAEAAWATSCTVGAVYAQNAFLFFAGATVTGNSALGNVNQRGAQIYAMGSDGQFSVAEIRDSTVEGNFGGAVAAAKGSRVSVAGSSVSRNDGGAFDVATGASVVLVDTVVRGNDRAEGEGGAFRLEDATVTLDNATVSHNEARWGGAFALLGGSEVVLRGGVHDGNVAGADGGFAYFAGAGNEFNATGAVANGSAAYNDGGALAVQSQAADTLIAGLEVTESKVSVRGAALYVGTDVSGLALYNVTSRAHAHEGFGVFYLNVRSELAMVGCASRNDAVDFGVVYAAPSSRVALEGCVFDGATSRDTGVVLLSLGRRGAAVVNGTRFSGCDADGGAVRVEGSDDVAVRDTEIRDSKGRLAFSLSASTVSFERLAVRRGGQFLSEGSTATFDDCVFADNAADNGAAGMVDDSEIVLRGSRFSGNTAENSAGALDLAASALVSEGGNVFDSNRALAGDGGALRLAAGATISLRGDDRFANNSAPNGGGGVAFVADAPATALPGFGGASEDEEVAAASEEDPTEEAAASAPPSALPTPAPTALNASRPPSPLPTPAPTALPTAAAPNVAGYGPTFATQAVAIVATFHGAPQRSGWAFEDASISVVAYDAYEQVAKTYAETGRLAPASPAALIITGDADNAFKDGVATFPSDEHERLTFSYGSPTDENTVRVKVHANYGHLTTFVNVTLRACVPGEFPAESGRCEPCPLGTYWRENGCHDCDSGHDCDEPGMTLAALKVKRGWWRPDTRTSKVFRCEVDEACEAGAAVAEDACAEGYEGAACGACSWPDYSKDPLEATCEKCTKGSKVVVAAVVVVGAAVMVGAFCIASWWAGRNALRIKSSRLYRVTSMARVKLLWITGQTISSVQNVLEMRFPPPFSGFLGAIEFFQLDLGFLPMNCVAKFQFYEQLLTSTVGPVALLALVALATPLRLRIAGAHTDSQRRDKNRLSPRERIVAVHTKAALFVVFVTYPTTARAVFEVLRPCDRFGSYGGSYLKGDATSRCGTRRYRGFLVYGGLMTAAWTVGIPLALALVLYYYRDRVDPEGKDDVAKRRTRLKDKSIRNIDFLWRDYRPSMLYAEPLLLVVRVCILGVLAFCGKDGARAATGTLLALILLSLAREVQPFQDRFTNMFAYCCALVVFFTYIAALLNVSRPFGFAANALGGVLIATCGALLALLVYFATIERAHAKEQTLRLREMEFREIEADLDVIALRADVDHLRAKYEPQMLAAERDFHVEDFGGKISEAERPTLITASGLAAKKTPPRVTSRTFSRSHSRGSPGGRRLSNEIHFTNGLYPCYVISLTNLRKLDRLPTHELALERELLEVLTPASSSPSSAYTYFISQNWETFGEAPHPDNARNTKLRWLQNLHKHMRLPPSVDEVWLWWDLVSIPQSDRERQKNAIRSLCYYAQLCSRFIPLVRDEKCWGSLYEEDISHPDYPTAGALETYAARGWCRLEILAALAPKKFSTGAWRPGPRSVRFRYHHDPEDAGVGPRMREDLLRDPLGGNYTDETDKTVIKPVLERVAERYAEYARSGSDAWDATLDVRARPDWLKRLAGVDPACVEGPASLDYVPFSRGFSRAFSRSSFALQAGPPSAKSSRDSRSFGDGYHTVSLSSRTVDGQSGGSSFLLEMSTTQFRRKRDDASKEPEREPERAPLAAAPSAPFSPTPQLPFRPADDPN